ncbi:iron-compound ABC transporter, ATP-binding protein, partial [mine drainage metagenome]
DLDLAVAPGEFVALTGPNGSGKTTLLRAALGFVDPERGAVRLFGTPVRELTIRARARRVAWVPQSEPQRDDVPLLRYVLYGRYSLHRPLDGDSVHDLAVAHEVLAAVGLSDREDDGVLSMSGGERQRAILARALVQDDPAPAARRADDPPRHRPPARPVDPGPA